MRKTFGKTRRNFPIYQVAGTLLVVATLGFTAIYFGQRGQDMAEEGQQQAEVETAQKEETKDVSAVVLPKSDEVTEPLQEPEVIITLPQADIVQDEAEEPAKETVAAERHFEGHLQWPLEGNVLIPYSMDKTVYFATLKQYQYNPAMIIGGKVNDAVTSVAPGKVSAVETSAKTGCTVTVNLGDGYEVVYGQLKEVSLAAGDTVNTGDIIGYISEPTKYYSVEGANLYFQLKHQGQAVDPMEYLSESE